MNVVIIPSGDVGGSTRREGDEARGSGERLHAGTEREKGKEQETFQGKGKGREREKGCEMTKGKGKEKEKENWWGV